MRVQTARRCSGICQRSQSGIALLMLVIVIVLVMSSFYFNSISLNEIKNDEMVQTRKALADAKQGLIDYAVMHASVNGADNGIGRGDPGEYGYLPCPYIDAADGNQNANCGNRHVNTIGLLPWATMQTDILRDGSGNCLWYAVSGSYKNWQFSGLLNQDSPGMLQVVDEANNIVIGNNIEDRPVAMIIAPGHALAGQLRVNNPALACGTDGTQLAQYLDSNGVTDNATLNGAIHVPDAFIHARLASDPDDDTDDYNDQFVLVTRDEIWQAVYRTDIDNRFAELTEAIAQCLANYANEPNNEGRKLPTPAPLDLATYRDEIEYDDDSLADAAAAGYVGRIPWDVDDSNTGNTLAGAVIDDIFDDPDLCENIDLPSTAIVEDIDLNDVDDMHRKLFMNWKDHFFYALSENYKPENVPLGGYVGCGNCVDIAGTEYAAIVFFSGQAEGGQTRVFDDIAATDDKATVGNYLENGNDAVFAVASGDDTFFASATGDIMFCVTDAAAPAAVAC